MTLWLRSVVGGDHSMNASEAVWMLYVGFMLFS